MKPSFHEKLFQKKINSYGFMPGNFQVNCGSMVNKNSGCQPQLKPLDTDFDKIAWYHWFWTGICFGTTPWVLTWIFWEHFNGVTLLFEHLPSLASKLEHFQILVVHKKINSPNIFHKILFVCFIHTWRNISIIIVF